MSITEVQTRIATITARLDALAPRGRARVDPLLADAFAATMESAVAATPGGSASTVSPTSALAGSGSSGSSGYGTSTTAATGAAATAAAAGTAGVPTGAPTAGGPTGADVVSAARAYLGVRYTWGGTDPATGFDCSGLVQRVFADLGVKVPRTVADQRNAGTEVASMAEARPGDLLAYASAGSPSGRHIGIYLGNGQMIDAPRSGRNVEVGPVWDAPVTIRRIVPAEAAAAAGSAPAAQASVAGASVQAARPAWAGGTDLATVFADATARYSLPEGLLQAVAQRESGMRTDAVSPAGARGLMQLMPGTAAELGVDPMDPVQAVDGGARYLRQQLDTFGSLDLALAAYNAGPGNVRRHGGIPPFEETRAYVAAITTSLGGR